MDNANVTNEMYTVEFSHETKQYLRYMILILFARVIDITSTIIALEYFGATEGNLFLSVANSSIFLGFLAMIITTVWLFASLHIAFKNKYIGINTLRVILLIFILVCANNVGKIIYSFV